MNASTIGLSDSTVPTWHPPIQRTVSVVPLLAASHSLRRVAHGPTPQAVCSLCAQSLPRLLLLTRPARTCQPTGREGEHTRTSPAKPVMNSTMCLASLGVSAGRLVTFMSPLLRYSTAGSLVCVRVSAAPVLEVPHATKPPLWVLAQCPRGYGSVALAATRSYAGARGGAAGRTRWRRTSQRSRARPPR
jgi:hypothetical protein